MHSHVPLLGDEPQTMHGSSLCPCSLPGHGRIEAHPISDRTPAQRKPNILKPCIGFIYFSILLAIGFDQIFKNETNFKHVILISGGCRLVNDSSIFGATVAFENRTRQLMK